MLDEADIQLRYQVLDPVLDERSRQRWAAAEAKGQITALHVMGMPFGDDAYPEPSPTEVSGR